MYPSAPSALASVSPLLARAEREALVRGLVRMRLDTAKPAQDLIGWYETSRLPSGRRGSLGRETCDSVVMEKDLSKTD